MLLAPVENTVLQKGTNSDPYHHSSKAQRLTQLRVLVVASLILVSGVKAVICKATAQPLRWDACQCTLSPIIFALIA